MTRFRLRAWILDVSGEELIRATMFLAVGAAFIVTLNLLLPYELGPDWRGAFRLGARELVTLRNPFTVEQFFHPPWLLIPLIPVALLPPDLSYAVYVAVALFGFGWSARRFGAKPVALLIFLLSPVVLHTIIVGNLDWMILLGFTLPPSIGLLILVAKPQMTMVVIVFWLVEAWRDTGARGVVKTFAPVTVAYLVSFILFGLWPLEITTRVNQEWNASLWPFLIPVGLVLAVQAFRTRKINYAIGASPALSPYLMFHSYVGALATQLESSLNTGLSVAGLWLIVLFRYLGSV